MAIKTVFLDSSPSINLHDPSNIPLNISPAYINRSKNRGQPILGQKQIEYTYFVPMGSGSDHIKELLALEETDNSKAKPVEASDELLKAEKMIKGEPPFDSSFEKDAKQFMDTPKTHIEDTFQVNDDETAADTSVKNDSDFANLIAASQPKKSNYRKPSKPRKKKPKKKQPAKKIKKMKKFRIIRNKK